MKKFLPLLCLLAMMATSCFKEVGVPVTIDFVYTLTDSSSTVPVNVSFTNRCIGATNYRWTFEGGEPSSSNYENPGTVVYKQAGVYTVKLEAWNEDSREIKELTLHLDSAVQVAFDADIVLNDFSPVTVAFTNHTTGATAYTWTFEGGEPAASSEADPGTVTFTTPGNHLVTLTVDNGSKKFSTTRIIAVKAPLSAEMELTPSFNDDDLEAPLIATLNNKSTSFITQRWLASGGIIADDTLSRTSVYFEDPGTYVITLQVGNGKGSETVTKEIVVKPNSGLRTLTDVKLGISTAYSTIGCFYSTRLRKVYREGDDLSVDGREIDIAFFGLSQAFTYNKFISPLHVSDYAFPVIPAATASVFINSAENCGCASLTSSQFDAMTDDAPLRALTIQASDAAERQFDSNILPRIILFKTQDGRKGAIKVKEFVADGRQSYLVTDIKIQKYE